MLHPLLLHIVPTMNYPSGTLSVQNITTIMAVRVQSFQCACSFVDGVLRIYF